jgi:phage major head subunit gpT-like protein
MLNASALVTAEKIMKTIYNEAVGAMAVSNPFIRLLICATMTTSDGAEEDYRWLGAMPTFQEWFGDITVDDLATYAYTLRNRHFYGAVGIDSDELDDDKWNLITPRIQSLAQRSLLHRGRLIHDLIINGTSYLAFDGIAFFADATGVRVNDNLLAGTISAATPTVAQVMADIDTMRKAMLAFVDDKGEIIGVTPDTFVIPPNLERVFRTAATATSDPTLTSAGGANPAASWIREIVVDPALTDANDFYGLCTTYPVKPFVLQMRQEVDIWLRNLRENVNKKLTFGADYRCAAGLALPVLAAKAVSAVG